MEFFIQGKKFGVTDFVNSTQLKNFPEKDHDSEPIEQVLMKMTDGIGLDYAFECCSIPNCMTSALNACRSGTGVLTLVGLAAMNAQVSFNPWLILTGRRIKGTYFGGIN